MVNKRGRIILFRGMHREGITGLFYLSRKFLLPLAVASVAVWPVSASAESILGALAKAYDNNPDLNAARAQLRAVDEGVAIAKSGYRPRIAGGARWERRRRETKINTPAGSDRISVTEGDTSVGITFTQNLFNGFQTRNNVRSAESDVYGEQQNLLDTEQSILLSAAQIYANVVRDAKIVQVRRQNLEFLIEQRNAAQARFDVGEGTRTDIALAQASLESARAQLLAAQAQYKSSVAVYVQIIGTAPKNLQQPTPIIQGRPSSLDSAVATGLREHPFILSSQYQVDSAAFTVKSIEGGYLPSVDLLGDLDYFDGGRTVGSVGVGINVPIYQGGETSARVRQAKEQLGQARILVDSARRDVEQNIVTDWAQLEAANASIAANRAQVQAAQLALEGIVEERKVGQATQLDVLQTQSEVLNAQEDLAVSQRDAVVASYSLLSSVGRLTVPKLGLHVAEYRYNEHYEQVKDKWFGLRTVDGR